MVLFGALSGLAEGLAVTGSRLKKRAAIELALVAAAGESTGEAGLFAQYLAGQPFAEADGRKLNAGGALLSKAVLAVSGATDAALTVAYRRHGDLGAAAHDLLVERGLEGGGQGSGLTLLEVEAGFAAMAGARTTAVRAGVVEDLLRRGTAVDAKYLLKLMLGDMRIGVKQALVEEAIAGMATTLGQAADAPGVRQAVMLEADLVRAVRRAVEGTLGEARMTLFHPLGFMLASPVETPEEAVARFTAKPEKVKVAKPAKRSGRNERQTRRTRSSRSCRRTMRPKPGMQRMWKRWRWRWP